MSETEVTLERSTRFSTVLLSVVLAPAMLQSGDCNSKTGDTSLSLLELEAAGQNRVIAFDSSEDVFYDVWVPEGEDAVVVRVESVDPGAQLTLNHLGAGQQIGIGSGEVTVSVPLGTSTITVFVKATGGAVGDYWLNVTRDVEPAPCNQGVAQLRPVGVGCTTNPTGDPQQPILAFQLSVNASPIQADQTFTADIGGVAVVEEWVLDILQAFVTMGGTRQLELHDLVATVQVRAGATGPDVPLVVDGSALVPGLTNFCALTRDPCDPANDVDPADPSAGNTDCQPMGSFNACRSVLLVDVPITSDGATCEALGGLKPQHFAWNGFCVTGPLPLPLATQTASYTAGASGGEVLWGWADQRVPGLVLCPDASEPRCASNGGEIPDGTYALPLASSANPTAPIGARASSANGLFVAQQCAMARQSVDGTGAAIPDVVEPTLDSDLIACPIHAAACLVNSDCPSGYNCVNHTPVSCGSGGVCEPVPGSCDTLVNLACGCDGVTYSNYCGALVAGVRASALGPCECTVNGDCNPLEYCNAVACDGPGTCTVMPGTCSPGPGNVVGCDGLTYDSVCEAAASAVRVGGELYPPSPF